MENDHLESNHSFDNTYREKAGIFGLPYQELQSYFKNRAAKGNLLDLGCGQGRDSIFLASLGYEVTAVDSSKVGIDQMMNSANEKGVKINGMVQNVLSLQFDEKFDVVLFDMILHSFDEPQQQELIEKYSKHVNKDGIMCIVFPNDLKTDHFISMLGSIGNEWKLLEEITIKDIPKIEDEESDLAFVMLVVQLISS